MKRKGITHGIEKYTNKWQLYRKTQLNKYKNKKINNLKLVRNI